MPTILRKNGFAVIINTNDHPPRHVHVIRAEEIALIFIGDEGSAPALRENRSMKPATLRRALELVAENQASLIEEWRRIHG